jgi:hypothetical protein
LPATAVNGLPPSRQPVAWSTDNGSDLRKFIFNGSIISSIFGGLGVVQTTRKGPRDWRLILMWVSWGISLAIAVGTVVEQAREANELER